VAKVNQAAQAHNVDVHMYANRTSIYHVADRRPGGRPAPWVHRMRVTGLQHAYPRPLCHAPTRAC